MFERTMVKQGQIAENVYLVRCRYFWQFSNDYIVHKSGEALFWSLCVFVYITVTFLFVVSVEGFFVSPRDIAMANARLNKRALGTSIINLLTMNVAPIPGALFSNWLCQLQFSQEEIAAHFFVVFAVTLRSSFFILQKRTILSDIETTLGSFLEQRAISFVDTFLHVRKPFKFQSILFFIHIFIWFDAVNSRYIVSVSNCNPSIVHFLHCYESLQLH